MAKIVDYPRASLDNSLQLAEAVSSLGGSCSVDMAAEKMGRKVGGAFTALVSAAVKYGLVASKDGRLAVQPLYRSIKLAYTEDEKRAFLAQALLSAPLFRSIAERFDGHVLPTDHFEKLLIREFDVPQELGSRIAQYFVQGSKQAGLLSANGVLSLKAREEGRELTPDEEADDECSAEQGEVTESASSRQTFDIQPDEFSIRFVGPGLNSVIIIRDSEDLLIVEAMLKKVERSLKERSQQEQ